MTQEGSPMSATARIKSTSPVPLELVTRERRVPVYHQPSEVAAWDRALLIGGVTLIALATVWFATSRARRFA
jgi:hypothetical protein